MAGHGLAGSSFTLTAPWGSRRLRLAMPGRHLVPLALAAAVAADRFGTPLADVEAALAAGSHAAHRMAPVEATGGATLIDDTYNAAPWSVAAALELLAETPLPAGRRRYAVLGDMLELGPDEERQHREVGRLAASVVDGLVTVGERGRWIAEAARDGGLGHVVSVDDADAAVDEIERELAPTIGDVVLLKASRGIGLERAVDALAAPPAGLRR